jgi:hypothetical protein
MSFSQTKLNFSPPPVNGLSPHSLTQQPPLVCTWFEHAPQSGPSPSPFPRGSYTLTTTAPAAAAGEFLLFGGYVPSCVSSDLYVFSARDFSSTLLQTSGEAPSPRATHGAALIGTTLLIFGGVTDYDDQCVLNVDSLYLLNLGTSDLLISSLTPADHNFALQHRESGPALWSMVPDRAVVAAIPQSWSVPSSSSSVVGLAGRPSTICGHSI